MAIDPIISDTITPGPGRKRWTQNTTWYLFVPKMEEAFKKGLIRKVISRKYFKELLNKICAVKT